MKKIGILLLCLMCLCACSKYTPVVKDVTEEQVSIPQESETRVKGTLNDMTSTRMTIALDDGSLLNLDRTNMTNEGDTAPFIGAYLEVCYIKQENKGKTYKVLSVTSNDDEKINDYITNMTLEEKVGQLFMVRCPTSEAFEVVTQYHIGGYIMFNDVIEPYTKDQFIANNAAYQNASNIPLFIGVDEEGGTVNRISWYETYRNTPFLSPRQLYVQGGLEGIRMDTQEKNTLLQASGINLNFAPVADVSSDPDDFIYERSFGGDAQETATYVKTVVQQMENDQMGSVLKHFPGYGNNVDTHTGSSLDERPLTTFETSDFIPFQAGIQANASMVLVSHNVMTCVDTTNPASLSKEVHTLLRNKLDFQGVVITDDLYMDAIRQFAGDEQAAVMAVQAGNDMLISSNYQAQIQAVIQAVQNGDISEEQLHASLHRILRLKIDLGIWSLPQG